MFIPISISQLLELLTFHGALNSVSLINHKWLAAYLYENFSTKQLWQAGAYLERISDNNFVLWTTAGWIREHRNRQTIQAVKTKSLKEKCMKIAEILGYSTEEMEQWTDAQREEYCREHFTYTRPESKIPLDAGSSTNAKVDIEKEAKPKKVSARAAEKAEQKALAASILASFGVDLEALKKAQQGK